MAVPLQIVVEDDAGRRQVVPFAEDEIAVGRAAGGLCLPERNVSRRHARFVRANGAVFVEDLDSRNGTLVNGERLSGRRRIREGDLVQIGDYDLAVEGSEDRAHEPDSAPTRELPLAGAPPPLPIAARPEPPPPLPAAASPAPAPVRPDLVPALAGATAAAVPRISPWSELAAAPERRAAPAPWRRAGFYVAVGAVSTLVGWAAGIVLNAWRGQ